MPREGETAEGEGNGGTPPWRPEPDVWLPCSVCAVAVNLVVLLSLVLALPTQVVVAASICVSDISCSSVTVCPLDGIVSCTLANVGTPYRRQGVVRGEGSSCRSR